MAVLQLIQMKSGKSIEKEYEEDIKYGELAFNQSQTMKLQALPLYVKYKQWLRENGALIDPRLQYPSYFGSAPNGIVGISASKPIERSRAIIAIPYSLLITVDKVRENKDLSSIIDNHFVAFGKKDDLVLKILIMYVVYELLKGEQSFYHPYFAICANDYPGCWSNWTPYKLQHRGVMRDLKQLQEDIELQYMKFLRIFRGQDKIFPQNISNNEYRNLFDRAYYLVTTRAFGWSLPSISLIPLADSLNHGNFRFLNHFVTNVDLEKDSECAELKFRKEVNLAILRDEYFTLSNDELTVLRKEPKSKQVKFIEKHKEILIQSEKMIGNEGQKGVNVKSKADLRTKHYRILHQQYKAGIHKLKNLHFYESSCSEDNDTDEETIYEREKQREELELQDLQRVITQAKKKKEVKKLWKSFLEDDESESSEEEEKGQSLPKLKNEALKQQIEQKLYKNEDSSEVSSEQPQELDQQFQWLGKANPLKTYFVMNTKEIIRENEQVYNFYGRRSNRFLLMGYNFIMQDNVYDSFSFRIKLDEKITTRVPVSKLLESGNRKEAGLCSRQIRLKRFRVNIELINLCRSYIILWSKKEYKNCRLFVPFDREIQQKTLELYLQFLNHHLKEYTTSLEEDEELLEETKAYEERVAIGLRIEYKKILSGQLSLINRCLLFLKRWKAGQPIDLQQSQMRWAKRVRPYLLSLQRSICL